MRKSWKNDEDVLEEARKYQSRTDFQNGSPGAFAAARRRNLVDKIHPIRLKYWSDTELIAEGKKYHSRSAFFKGSCSAYVIARQRGLLDQTCPSLHANRSDWSNDEVVLTEGRRYRSRAEFVRMNGSAYQEAWKRGLLDLIDFPEKNATCDNDAVYMWQAVGEFYNGKAVFKFGVTSARLGTRRIKEVSKASGFDFEISYCTPVRGRASEIEVDLLNLGEDPKYLPFDGHSEFRALMPYEVEQARSIIKAATS